MLLINSSPRQFINCLALLRVLFLLCACSSRDVSLHPPTSVSSDIPGRPSALENTFSPGEVALTPGKVFHRVGGSARVRILSNASLVTPAPTPTSISVFPTRASLHPSQALQFTAAVTGATHHAVRWLVEGHEGGDASVGTVSATGVYTAPPGPAPWPSVTITAVSADKSEAFASAVVMIMPALRDDSTNKVRDPASGLVAFRNIRLCIR
jgi:hypothetical protein